MKRSIVFLVLGLFLFTALIILYRVIVLGYPVLPTAPGKSWRLYAHAHIKADKEGIGLALGLPSYYGNRVLIEEHFSSGELNFNIVNEGPNRFGVWSGGSLSTAEQMVSYETTILLRHKRFSMIRGNTPKAEPVRADKDDLILARRIAGRWSALAAPDRIRAVAAGAAGTWGAPAPEKQDMQAWPTIVEKYGPAKAMLILFQAAGLQARPAEGIFLKEGLTKAPVKWIEAWDDTGWVNVSIEKGEVYRENILFLPLATDGSPAVKVSHGDLIDMSWVVTRQPADKWGFHAERIAQSGRLIDQWSLFHLPPDFQRTFRILILVPIGALMISILRNMIGFPTFGIFMPVLMALAFRSTGLAFGIGIFGGIILLGYGVRRYIDRLRLLLVPRMSVLLTLVIACFVVLALTGNRLGIKEFMAVGLLPFVILAMTIERFFLIIEESGAVEAFRTACGSAAVAGLTYQIISWDPLQLTFFVYPELLASVAAVQILIGRYTGYRLSEFIRFRTFKGQ